MIVSKRALRRYIDRAVAREVHRIRYTDGLVDGIKQRLQFAYQKLASSNNPAARNALKRIEAILGVMKRPEAKKAIIASAVIAGTAGAIAGIANARANNANKAISGTDVQAEKAMRQARRLAESLQNAHLSELEPDDGGLEGHQGELFG